MGDWRIRGCPFCSSVTDEHSENCKAIRCHFDGARPVLVSPSVAMDSTNTDARCPSCDQLRARVAELQAKWDAQGVKDGETFMETRKLVSRVAELERDLTSAIQVRDQAWADKKAAKEARFKAERERDEARAEVASLKAKYALDTAFLRTLAKKAYTDTQVTVEAATLRAERAEQEVTRWKVAMSDAVTAVQQEKAVERKRAERAETEVERLREEMGPAGDDS